MDWDKVTENLKSQVEFYTSQANSVAIAGRVGAYETSRRWRACADTASILLSAVRAGRIASSD
jgi:hypothetical protein